MSADGHFDLAQQIDKFTAQRRRRKQETLARARMFGTAATTFGVLVNFCWISSFGAASRRRPPVPSWLHGPMLALSSVVWCCGYAVLNAAPYDLPAEFAALTTWERFRQTPSDFLFTGSVGVFSFYLGAHPPHLHSLQFVVCVLYIFRGHLPGFCRPTDHSFYFLICIGYFVGWMGFHALPHDHVCQRVGGAWVKVPAWDFHLTSDLHICEQACATARDIWADFVLVGSVGDEDPLTSSASCTIRPWVRAALVSWSSLAVAVLLVVWYRDRQRLHAGRGPADPPPGGGCSLMQCMPLYYFEMHQPLVISNVFVGVCMVFACRRYYRVSGAVMGGMAVVMLFRRRQVWNFVSKRFEVRQAVPDGAFIAYLFDSIKVVVGQTWWVLRPDDAVAGAETWVQGEVAAVREGMFAVITDDDKRAASAASRAPLDPADVLVWWVKSSAAGGGGMNAAQLQASCLANLRCVEWAQLSAERFENPGYHSKVGEFDSCTRPLREGETIDFFISHSWHDSAVARYSALKQLVAEFEKEYGRPPTFWFDKMCMVHEDDKCLGVRVLPIVVMACDKIVALCGPTFPSRLWCVWELCMLSAFVPPAQAAERVRFFEIDGGSLGQLRGFTEQDARCFDPNEQAMLRRLTDELGDLESRVRELAECAAVGVSGVALAASRPTRLSHRKHV